MEYYDQESVEADLLPNYPYMVSIERPMWDIQLSPMLREPEHWLVNTLGLNLDDWISRVGQMLNDVSQPVNNWKVSREFYFKNQDYAVQFKLTWS